MKYDPLPRHPNDVRDTEDEDRLDEQRRRARRLGGALVLLVVLIVGAVFAWKLSITR